MMSVNSYLEHFKKYRDLVDSEYLGVYWWPSSDFDEIEKNMKLAMVNLCKVLLTYNNISFQDKSTDEIIDYFASLPKYATIISMYQQSIDHWTFATKRRDRNTRNFQLSWVVRYLDDFEAIVRNECNL